MRELGVFGLDKDFGRGSLGRVPERAEVAQTPYCGKFAWGREGLSAKRIESCARCAPRHRVLMQFMLTKDGWSVSFLEEDCKTSIRDNTEQDCSDERRLRLYPLHLTSDQLPNPGWARRRPEV